MSDLAFETYCIACDKMCPSNSLYCSEECKNSDEAHSHNIIDQNRREVHIGADYERLSPLLTPALYQNYSNYTVEYGYELSSSPFSLPSTLMPQEAADFENNVLGYEYSPAVSHVPTGATSNLADHLPSTSNNYRKWLTACL